MARHIRTGLGGGGPSALNPGGAHGGAELSGPGDLPSNGSARANGSKPTTMRANGVQDVK